MEASERPGHRGVIIFGEVLWDLFPGGEEVLGGAAFNLAWNLRGFDLDPLIVTRVGDDALGERAVESFREWKLDAAGVQRDPGRPTGTVRVTVSGGEPSFEIVADQAYDRIDGEAALEAIGATSDEFLYHGTLALRSEVSRSALESIRRETALPGLVDVNLRPPWWTFDIVERAIRGARVVKVNDDELITLGDLHGLGSEDLADIAEKLRSRWDLETLLVTRGENGAWALGGDGGPRDGDDRDGAAWGSVDATAVEVVDTVGAGDAFLAVFVLGRRRAWDSGMILRRAVDFAASVCTLQGAITQDLSFYRGWLERWEEAGA